MSNVERRKPCDVQLPPPPPPAAAADVLLMRLQGGDAVSSDGKLEYNRFAERVEVVTIWYSLRLSANIDFKPSLRAISNRFLIIFFLIFAVSRLRLHFSSSVETCCKLQNRTHRKFPSM